MRTNDILFGSIKDINKWVYHYTSMDTAIQYILTQGTIRLSLFRDLNDPKESKDFSFSMSTNSDEEAKIDYTLEEIQNVASNYVKSHCKVLCMVKDNINVLEDNFDSTFHRGFARPRMWAQYSKNHSGVCLIFNKKKLQQSIESTLLSKGNIYWDDIEYSNSHTDNDRAFNLNHEEIDNNTLNVVLDNKINEFYKTYFFTKSEDWSSENEWRCVFRGDNKEAEFVSIKESICGIVLGVDFPKVYESAIVPFSEEYSIPIARIQWPNGMPIVVPVVKSHN